MAMEKPNLQEFKLGSDPTVSNGTIPPVVTLDKVAPIVTPPANISVTAGKAQRLFLKGI